MKRTTPEAIDLQRLFREMLDAGDRSVAMEASSHASALHRLDHVRFAVLVFTNLSHEHLDFHGDMEDYFEAKRRLFVDGQPAGGGQRRRRVRPPARRRAARCADVRLRRRRRRSAPTRSPRVELKLRGRFNVENALGALAAARLLGIDDDAIARGLESVRGVPGRFESIDEGQPFEVIVDYAHKPVALETLLRTVRELAAGRVICVFGCGGDRDREKRPQMGRIASELADVVIVTNDNPRSEDPQAIIDAIVAGAVGAVEVEPDRARAIARAIELAQRRRRRPDRRQGRRAGAGVRRPHDPVRRPRVGARGAAHAGSAHLIPLPLAELRGLGRLEGDADEVTGVEVDSRRVSPGDLFVAVGGGDAFLDDARARGAAATLVPDDAFAALAAIGRAVRARSSARVVAITGSVGKTSTKDILAALCAPHVRLVAAEAGFNNEIGVPLTLCRIEPDTEVVVTEMGMRGAGQIRALAEIARPRRRA